MACTREALIAFTLCLVAPPLAHSQALWAGHAGGGMLAVQETDLVGKHRLTLGFGLDGLDRDPLGLDIVEIPLAWRFGLSDRVELWGRSELSKAVLVAQVQPWPPPPTDIVLAPGATAPKNPYRSVYWQMPYLADHSASVVDTKPGEHMVGAKWLALKEGVRRPSVALNAYVTFPSGTDSASLARGAGLDAPSVGGLVAAQRGIGRWSVSTNLGYRILPSVHHPDQVIDGHTDRSMSIRTANILSWGAGVRVRLRSWCSLSGEYSGLAPVGGHTTMLTHADNHDVLAGLHLRMRRLGVSIGYRQHLWPQPNGEIQSTGPLGGGVDLTKVAPQQRAEYLASLGAPTNEERQNTSLVVLGEDPGLPLPPGAIRIPATYRFSTTGNSGIVFALSVGLK